jgi:hypothetical protein
MTARRSVATLHAPAHERPAPFVWFPAASLVFIDPACTARMAPRVHSPSATDRTNPADTTNTQRRKAAMAAQSERIGEWAGRIRAEFLEMPGLVLTRWQIRRLWLLDPSLCDAVLDTLIQSGFLRRRRDNTYCRADDVL